MKPWNKVKWQKANADLANRPFADLFWNRDEVCVRCGRHHTIANAVHTRLHGYMCVCGSQEWKAAEQSVQRTGLRRGVANVVSTTIRIIKSV